MMYLPLANLLHHKLRSLLSAGGVAIGVCMLLTLSGLARGTLFEVADRWESVDADLIVFPRGWGDNAPTKIGSGLSDAVAPLLRREHSDLVARVVPVFTWTVRFGKLDQMVVGLDAGDWAAVSRGRGVLRGRLPDANGRFSAWLTAQLSADGDEPFDPSADELARAGGLEAVIDSRLAAAEGLHVGDRVFAANHTWTIVGIAPAGVLARVFIPRRTAQLLFADGNIAKSTLMFVKLTAGVDVGPAARTLSESIRSDVIPLTSYRGLLIEKFGIMFLYVNAVNAVALVIAFLFTMTILYTTVLQQTREIAILKSFGASWLTVLRLVLGESAVLTAGGVLLGVLWTFPARWAIEAYLPLYTVTVTWRWVAIAILAAAAGAGVAAIYPAWRAARVDMVEALTYE